MMVTTGPAPHYGFLQQRMLICHIVEKISAHSFGKCLQIHIHRLKGHSWPFQAIFKQLKLETTNQFEQV